VTQKAGDRVQLISTTDPYTRLEPGVRGTVRLVDAVGTVHVDWDNGSRLGLVPDEDQWRVTDGTH
jgi:urease beta subunit